MHFYAGLLVGPFLAVAAVTGLLYALIPQVDRMVYRHELTVDHVGEHRLPLSAQLAAARAAHPEGDLQSINPPAAANATTRVVLRVADVPADYSRTVFVDPYSGQVRGALTTSGEWLPLRAWFDELHRNLHLGAVGRNYSELAASWLWVLALSGSAMWVVQRRRRGVAALLTPGRSAGRRGRALSWHGSVGVWILVGLLGLSATGLTWSRYAGEHVQKVREELSWVAPSVGTPTSARPAAAARTPIGPAADRALAAADRAGLRGPLWLYPGGRDGGAWQVTERKRDCPTRGDSIAVDPVTGAQVQRIDFAQWPFMAKLTRWAIDAHMGILFGVANQVALVLLALGLLSVIVRGYQMWWRRAPKRTGLVGRGALLGLEPAEAVAFVAAVALVGWFVPLLGLSIGAFVILDGALGWRRGGQREGAAG
ncbi:MAG: PepSY domain-containing protein [Mycobacteriaceae bacterium]|nr:PepSY domain-containing protein [Mycobacteriaceae bacterium]